MITQTLKEKNLQAEIFCASIVADEIERMWNTRRQDIAAIAREIWARKPRAVVFFGSGGSAAALYSGYYAMMRYSKLPSAFLLSPEIVSARPALLNQETVAIGASYSGQTVDTLRAKQFLEEHDVPLLAVTRFEQAELAQGAAWSVTYNSKALYSSPVFLMILLTVELCRARDEWSSDLDALEQALCALPSLLRSISEASRELADRSAAALSDGKLLVLAGGGSYALGHMMAFDMFGEYLKQYCAFLHYGEFRHGPLEIVRNGEPTMMFLMGNDASRPFAQATIAFGRRNGARTVVFDVAELAPRAHPMLDPLVLYPSQLWVLYELACQRGLDLDHYHYMHVTPYAEGDTFF